MDWFQVTEKRENNCKTFLNLGSISTYNRFNLIITFWFNIEDNLRLWLITIFPLFWSLFFMYNIPCIRDKHSLAIMDEKTCGGFEEMFMIYFLSCFCINSGLSSWKEHISLIFHFSGQNLMCWVLRWQQNLKKPKTIQVRILTRIPLLFQLRT